MWNWNWKSTQDHYLIKRWSQRTHRCSAPVVGLEDYSAHDCRAATPVQRAPVTWREWGLWSLISFTHYMDINILVMVYFQVLSLLEQSGTKPNLVAKLWLPILVSFRNIYDVFRIMFNVGLTIMWLSIVVEGFPTPEIWKIQRATNCGSFSRKITWKAGTNKLF